jgi:hypothetical protein
MSDQSFAVSSRDDDFGIEGCASMPHSRNRMPADHQRGQIFLCHQFSGFGHPAVITVAWVLVMSRALHVKKV